MDANLVHGKWLSRTKIPFLAAGLKGHMFRIRTLVFLICVSLGNNSTYKATYSPIMGEADPSVWILVSHNMSNPEAIWSCGFFSPLEHLHMPLEVTLISFGLCCSQHRAHPPSHSQRYLGCRLLISVIGLPLSYHPDCFNFSISVFCRFGKWLRYWTHTAQCEEHLRDHLLITSPPSKAY